MDRKRALELIKKHVKNPNLQKHMLATEAVMKALANHFGEDEELWGLTGLLHDLDVEETQKTPEKHGYLTAEYLKKEDVPEEMIHAILAHSGKVSCKSRMDKALYAADPLTGFIVACALVASGRKLSSIDVKFAMRRMKEKRFAMGASREQMKSCTDLGLTLAEFTRIGIEAMQKIHIQLGL
ncbi:MAG: HDIG domain-containing protein [Candidatus Eremiobacteraeota bacterium]|nr:HDIG domain-containing protein [Candidatus Eremiobacteraeota bacterium]